MRRTNAYHQGQVGSSINLLATWWVQPECHGIEGVSIAADYFTCRGCSVIGPGALFLVKGLRMLQFDDAENGDCVLEFFHSESQ